MAKKLDTIIKLNNVSLTLNSNAGKVNILREINLSIKSGEALGVIGPSGSGKTSLLMVMAGLESINAGDIIVAKYALNTMSEDKLALFRQSHVGIVFQDFHLVPTMTALENTALPLEFANRSDAMSRARSELEAVGLQHRLDHYPSQLSGGEQQRVALARAFTHEPSILLADEPTGNLDAETGKKIMDLLFSLKERCNTTLVLVTHQPELAMRCSRTIQMLDGKISDAQ